MVDVLLRIAVLSAALMAFWEITREPLILEA
jgi:hypothetical protein